LLLIVNYFKMEAWNLNSSKFMALFQVFKILAERIIDRIIAQLLAIYIIINILMYIFGHFDQL
jgi:hypothetical protein